jgi:predicted dinucleotide-binding enzyme
MGAREANHERAVAWAGAAGAGARQSSFAGAAQEGELIINATAGAASLQALDQAGEENLAGKILIDVANPIAHDSGSPPTLELCNDTSLGERIQERFPRTRVVKALNTVNAAVMVDPERLEEPTSVFVCGEDAEAKREVGGLLGELGWREEQIVDVGAIEAARGTEMYLALWLRILSSVGDPFFNVRLVRGE